MGREGGGRGWEGGKREGVGRREEGGEKGKVWVRKEGRGEDWKERRGGERGRPREGIWKEG